MFLAENEETWDHAILYFLCCLLKWVYFVRGFLVSSHPYK